MITIVNKFDVKSHIPKENAILIRISSEPLLKMDTSKYKEVHEFFFDDVEDDWVGHLATDEELKKIKEIVLKDYQELVIHCDYGQGRSAAIGVFACKQKLNKDISSAYPDLNKYILKKLEEL